MNTSRITCGEIAESCLAVIASAAKQSIFLFVAQWIASLRFARNDDPSCRHPPPGRRNAPPDDKLQRVIQYSRGRSD
jgi:hypothetical protein